MKKFSQVIDTADWTMIILFGVSLMAMVAIAEIFDKKSEEKLIINGIQVKNDYDPIGFRIIFAWCIFVGSCVLYLICKYWQL